MEHSIGICYLTTTGRFIERLKKVSQVNDIAELRGIEGTAQVVYFGCFDDMILNQKECFKFESRSRRPPLNPINAMLSYIYSI